MTIKGNKNQVFAGKEDASEIAEDGYTYEITPLFAPMNIYFYVKTDNPEHGYIYDQTVLPGTSF